MFAAGNSAQVTEEDQQGVSAFEDFAEGDLFSACGEEGEIGSGGVGFHVSGFRLKVTSYRYDE